MADYEQQRRDLIKRIVEKIASDPQFREKMVDDPAEALASAGFNKEIHDLQEAANDAEVSGYAHGLFLDTWACL